MSDTPPQSPRRFNPEFIVTLALATVAWIFSAGVLWQKVDDLEKKVDFIYTQIFDTVQPQHKADLKR